MHCKKAFPRGKVAWAKPMTDEGDHGGAESLSHGFAVPAPFHKGAKGRGLRIATSARWASSQ